MSRPYTLYIQEKHDSLDRMIHELEHGPDNEANMRWALEGIILYARNIMNEAELKLKDYNEKEGE